MGEYIISTNRSYPKIKNSQTFRKSLFARFMPIWVFLLLIFLCMALLNTWYQSDTTRLASKIEEQKREKELLKDEITKLKIEGEQLTSPERIRKEVAPKLNMVLPESKPIELKKKL
jgi:cell division protein FtsL